MRIARRAARAADGQAAIRNRLTGHVELARPCPLEGLNIIVLRREIEGKRGDLSELDRRLAYISDHAPPSDDSVIRPDRINQVDLERLLLIQQCDDQRLCLVTARGRQFVECWRSRHNLVAPITRADHRIVRAFDLQGGRAVIPDACRRIFLRQLIEGQRIRASEHRCGMAQKSRHRLRGVMKRRSGIKMFEQAFLCDTEGIGHMLILKRDRLVF